MLYRPLNRHTIPQKSPFTHHKPGRISSQLFNPRNQTLLVYIFLSLFTTIPREIGYNIKKKKKKNKKRNSDEKFSAVQSETVHVPKIIKKKQKNKNKIVTRNFWPSTLAVSQEKRKKKKSFRFLSSRQFYLEIRPSLLKISGHFFINIPREIRVL